MRLIEGVRNRLVRRQYGRLERHFRTAGPEALLADGERRLLNAFHRAARLVPAYGEILRRNGVDPGRIATIEDFKRAVPIVDKETIFPAHDLRDLCAGGTLDGISHFFSSSGHSGVFSFGVETPQDAAAAALGLDFAFHSTFGVLDRRTLLINCLPMGVKVHTRAMPLAETSVRPDVIWELVKKLKGDFRQFILVGEHPFLKKTIEEGADHGVPWKDLAMHVVTGGEYIAESFRTYLGGLLGFDFDAPDSGKLIVSFGLSELAVSIFQENYHTIRIRRLAQADPGFRKALYGRDTPICPNITQYIPQQAFIETVPDPQGRRELVVSLLDPALKLPLIRYNTRDVVETMSYGRLEEILRDSHQEALLPPRRLPLAITWGKFKPLTTQGGRKVYPEHVKELLYANLPIARSITGNFRLQEAGEAAAALVQLRKGKQIGPDQADAFSTEAAASLEAAVRWSFIPYERFPFGFDHDFERKNRYV